MRGINLQSGMKTGSVVDPGLKTGVSWILKVQQTEAHSTGLMHHSRKLLFNYVQIFLLMKSHHFWKVFSSHIPVHYRI